MERNVPLAMATADKSPVVRKEVNFILRREL